VTSRPALPGRLDSARRWVGLAGLGAALLLALALAPGGLAPAAARAALAIAGLAVVAALLRRAGASAPPARLVIVARQPLGKDAGIALAELDGRALLLGFGAGGVQLLAGAPAPPAPGAAAGEVAP
jgi:flagellar protein FliO/FliZ